jgi:hypothetical protein
VVDLRACSRTHHPLTPSSTEEGSYCTLKAECPTLNGGSRGPLVPRGGRRYDIRDP